MKLIHKKLVWTSISLPILYKTIWAFNWQTERKIWKQDMITERTGKLESPIEEVKIEDIPYNTLSKQEFDEKWMYKPLRIRGIFDHSKETLVSRTRNDDRGYEVVTPLYTSVDARSGELKGIFVNRGRI